MKNSNDNKLLRKGRTFIAKNPALVVLVGLTLIFSILFPDRFLSTMNLSSILSQFVTIMLFALGPSIVTTTGCMDLTYVGIWMLGGILVWLMMPTLGLAAT